MPISTQRTARQEAAPVRERINPARLALRLVSKIDLPEFENEIRVRQVVGLARQTPIHALGNLGNAAIFAWVFWERVSHLAIGIWFGLFLLFTGVQLRRWHRKRLWAIPATVSRRAVVTPAYWALVAGLLWGVAAIYVFPEGDVALQVLVAFLTVGLASGAVASMVAQPIACLAFFIPSAVPVAVMLIGQRGAVDSAMAAMMTLYIVFLIVALMNGFSGFVETIRAKIENRSLASGLAELLEANRAKSQFLATMSHELRTPLNAIIGFSQLIKDEVCGPVGTLDYRAYAADIYSSGQNLLGIISDVLDMSKLEMDKLKLSADAIDLEFLIQDMLVFVNDRAVEKGVALGVDLPPGLPMLLADGIRVKQIVLNLLSNAVKFNKPGGLVRIYATVGSDDLSLHVTDTGIGMSEDKIAVAMEPFSQLGDAFARKYEGIGLGLPLAQGLLKLHGGQLTLSSVLNVGTTATATFPAERILSDSAQRMGSIAA